MAKQHSICFHCELPVRLSAKKSGKPSEIFCCLGCRMAAAVVGGGDGVLPFLEARLILAAFFAMGVMTFSLVLYGESIYDAAESEDVMAMRAIGRLGLTIFSLPVFLLLGIPILMGAWADFKQRVFRMDGLICLATLAAYVLSIRNTFANEGEVYFDTATMILVIVVFGRRLEAHSRAKGKDSAKFLAELLPESATVVLADGSQVERDPESLIEGDIVLVAPSSSVPADVCLLLGRSEVVESHMNGEHKPRTVGPHDEVNAGAVNGTGQLTARVLRPAMQGSLAEIRELLNSPLGATRFMKLSDRFASYLAYLALLLACGGGLYGCLHYGLGHGLQVALSVLLVACPCALGLATPVAYRAMRSAMARQGVLVKDPNALEAAAEVDRVILDKTGTLTENVGQLVSTEEANELEVQRLAALVGSSNHPLADAVVPSNLPVEGIHVVPGSGVKGKFDGQPCFAGSPSWMDEQGFSWQPSLIADRANLQDSGATMVAYAQAGVVRALTHLEQRLKSSTKEVVADLKRRGLEPKIFSGDAKQAVEKIGSTLKIEALGGLKPGDKLALLEQQQIESKCVLVVGDGINDAPMLRMADVGIVVARGTALARSQAGIQLHNDNLSGIITMLSGAKELRQVALGNIIWTLTYNVIALALATMGYLHPLAAAALMILSSLVVCARSYRLLHFKEGKK